ncbi:M50 family metallopeptidase [Bacillus sp. 1P06AnD]|uniref:M50 family metallopeptidase n=1 Tax=Bacillus sp. 1P06AnD TaxID=3132208 RepID=UPI00399FD59E
MSRYMHVLGKIQIHPVTWLVMGIAVLTAQFQPLTMLLLVVFFHEMGHALMAAHYKWRIKSITILPFGGMMETEEYGNRSVKEDMHVIIAGPLQHLWMLGLAYALLWSGVISENTFIDFSFVNASICLFNLMPIWPLDGGKLLFLFMSQHTTFLKSHQWVLKISLMCIGLLLPAIIWFHQFSLNIIIICLFLLVSIWMEWKQRHFVFMRFLLERHYGKRDELVKLKPIMVDKNEPLYAILQYFQRGCKHPVVVTDGGEETGSLDENEILHAYFSEKRTKDKVGDLLYCY